MVEMIVYEQWGKVLSAMNERLVKEWVKVSNEQGKTKPLAKFLDRSIEHLSKLTDNLEEAMFQEHKDATTHVFYGRPHEKE